MTKSKPAITRTSRTIVGGKTMASTPKMQPIRKTATPVVKKSGGCKSCGK